jgi:hypothetical protein
MTQVRRVGTVLVLAVVVLAGCRVDTRVDITVKSDGSGTLKTTTTLDADAVNQLGGATALATTVPLDDLRQAGWNVSAWTPTTNGGQTVSVSHPFSNQNQLVARLEDVAGPNGVLRNAKITRDRGWFSSKNEVVLDVDLKSPTAGVLTDTALAQRLRAAGVDPAALQAQLTTQLRSALHVSVVVHLPGGVTKTVDAVNGQVTRVAVSHSRTNWDRVVKFGLAVVLALLATIFVLAAAVSARRDRRRRAERIRAQGVTTERAPLM